MEKVQSNNEKNAWLERKNRGVGMDKEECGNVDRWMFGLLWRGKGRGKDGKRCYQAMRKRVRCAKVWE
ncbi:MAG: hypothetical protein IJM74_09130 [Bacteroidales bacterium]|nr:hypothetical protein [Bacteroidales bacterium]